MCVCVYLKRTVLKFNLVLSVSHEGCLSIANYFVQTRILSQCAVDDASIFVSKQGPSNK